jgi:hypothetical protein
LRPGGGGVAHPPCEKFQNELFWAILLYRTNSIYMRSSKCKRSSLQLKNSGFGVWSNFGHQLDEFRKFKIYKKKLAAEVFWQAAKN